jgi:nitroreductase
MDALHAILTRRSIREYTARPVPEEVIEQLLKAAMAAPSARNQQPWQFVVIDDRRVLDAIPKYNPNAAMLAHAPLAIAICGDLRLETSEGYWVQDCSAATQNLLLAAHASGLGAVWTGVYPRKDRVDRTKELLGLPDEVIPLNVIAIGYPAEEKEPSQRYNPTRLHRNRW